MQLFLAVMAATLVWSSIAMWVWGGSAYLFSLGLGIGVLTLIIEETPIRKRGPKRKRIHHHTECRPSLCGGPSYPGR